MRGTLPFRSVAMFATIFAGITLTQSSCTKDPSIHTGTYIGTGFAGCIGSALCPDAAFPDTAIITSGPGKNEIIIAFNGGLGGDQPVSVHAFVNGSQLTAPPQFLGINTSNEWSGGGSFNKDSVTCTCSLGDYYAIGFTGKLQ